MRVQILIPTQDNADILTECLDSLSGLILKDHSLNVLIVDNASQDLTTTVAQAHKIHPQVIKSEKNVSQAELLNFGLKQLLPLPSDFIWILYPDVVVDPNCLGELIGSAGLGREGGILGPKIYYHPKNIPSHLTVADTEKTKVIWYAGGTIDWGSLLPRNRYQEQIDTKKIDHDVETDLIPICNFFVKKRVFEEVGLFDEKYYLGFFDMDYCLKVQKSSWRLVYASHSLSWCRLVYPPTPPEQMQEYFLTRNRLLFGSLYGNPQIKLKMVTESLYLSRFGTSWQKRAVLDYNNKKFGSGAFQL